MDFLTQSLSKEKEFSKLSENISKLNKKKEKLPMLITGLSDGSKAAFYYSVYKEVKEKFNRGIVILTSNEKELRSLNDCLSSMNVNVRTFSSRDFVFHNIASSHEREHERISVLFSLIKNDYDIITATTEAVMSYTIPREALINSFITLKVDEDYSLTDLTKYLVNAGYVRVEMVSGTGQFSLRGSILDIFPPLSDFPVRADFFGDTLDSISYFDILSQRRGEKISEIELLPSR